MLKKEDKKIRICGINGLYLRRYSKKGKEKDLGKVNAVVVYDKKDGKERRRIYVILLDARKDPFKVYKCYKDRWTIENQGIRYLSQRWSLRDLAGRSLNSIQARIWTVLILYKSLPKRIFAKFLPFYPFSNQRPPILAIFSLSS